MSTSPVDLDEILRQNALQAVQRPAQPLAPAVAPFQATGPAAGLALPPVGPQTLKQKPIETKANVEAKPTEDVTKPIQMPANVQSPFPTAQMPAVQAPRGTVEGDEAARTALLSKRPAVEGIAPAIEQSKFGQAHPTWGKVLGNIAQFGGALGESVIPPGIAAKLPGTAIGRNVQLGEATRALTADEANREKEAQTAEQQAEVPLREAQTEAAREAPQLKEQAAEDKLTQAYRKLGLDAQGNPIPREQLSEQERARLEQSDSLQNLNDAREDLIRAQAAGEPEKIRLAEERLQQAQTLAQQRLGLQAEGLALRQNQAAGILPTVQMRNVAAQAGLVHEQMPALLQEISQMKDQIGPISGRWNEFMQGKIGAPNAEMAGLRSDLLMMSSAVALMHARGRLPENLREEFDKTINTPKQSAENLIAVLQHIDKWVEANMNAMSGQGGKTEQPAGDKDIDAIVNALKGGKK